MSLRRRTASAFDQPFSLNPPITAEIRHTNRPPMSYTLDPRRLAIIDAVEQHRISISAQLQADEAAIATANAQAKKQLRRTTAALRQLLIDTVVCMGFTHVMGDEQLADCCEELAKYQPGDFGRYFVDRYSRAARNILNYWNVSNNPLDTDLPAGPRTSASRRAQDQVREWYDSKCVVTRRWPSQSCHIIPDCVDRARNPRAYNTFWLSLGTFWPISSIYELQGFLSDPENATRNLIVMTSECHGAWGSFVFMLYPIAEESNDSELVLEFRYIRPAATLREGVEFQESGHYGPLHTVAGVALKTGDRIHIRTANPLAYPLPSAELLAIQVSLHTAITAAAAADALGALFSWPGDDDEPDQSLAAADSLVPDDDEVDIGPQCDNFHAYLILKAVQAGLIPESDVDKWNTRFQPGIMPDCSDVEGAEAGLPEDADSTFR